MSTTPKPKVPTLHNVKYMMGLIWDADKGLVSYMLYKNISEQLFDAFFSVYLTKYIYECIEQRTSFTKLSSLVIFFCLMQLIVHFTSAGLAYYQKLHNPIIYKSIFDKIIDRTRQLDLVEFERPDFYDKFTRAFDETYTRALETLEDLTYAIAYLVQAIAILGIISSVDPILVLFIIPGILGNLFIGKRKMDRIYELDKVTTRDKRVTEYCKRVFYEKKYASEIRLYPIKSLLLKHHKNSFTARYKTGQEYNKSIVFYEAIECLLYFAFVFTACFSYMAYRVKSGTGASIASYVAMATAIGEASYVIYEGIKRALLLKKHDLYIQNLRDFLEGSSAQNVLYIQSVTGKKEPITNINTIEFRNVTFTYEGASSPTIKNLSLTIQKGQRIALVGHNGAGKTTLVKLLMRLYKVTDGEILVGGKNINDYDEKEYLDLFGTVFQDLQIFALPLCENVLLHSPRTEQERALVVEALEKAQFGDTLDKLPNGIDTIVTKEFDENGVVFSGGQTQKIAIARVFAKNPDVVILDEPSSALDPIAEYNMYKNMMAVSKEKTVVFISHRLSSARVADKIYLLENGAISESGTHEELMKLHGTYEKMFTLQAKNYQDTVLSEKEA
ncbi:MAG: ABC transporter ATP-binding protein [bacterium]|nr:ABC transporter ATP-binding protein [bacterium]